MGKITTEAWVLSNGLGRNEPGRLELETVTFSDISEEEVLAEPVYGCWEGNMSHAINRNPIDVCLARQEEKVVLGNAGVVRILKAGATVKHIKAGDHCLVFCNGVWDDAGYPVKILAYDAPQTMGVLAKTTKLHWQQVLPIPRDTCFSLPQWAAFSLRYMTAYANWQVAYGCWRTQMKNTNPQDVFVCAWGGGVALAEVTLAKLMGCQVAMVASTPERLALLHGLGIIPIDRRGLDGVAFEERFLDLIYTKTAGKGVSIFIDNIGAPVYKLTIKALARQGVITTSGWKHGAVLPISRAMECINRHLYVHTHYARYAEGLEAMDLAQQHQWIAPITADEKIYTWDEIPRLVEDYASGQLTTYFPIFSINRC
ncbi:MAG: zinc-binding dehydrogenase [Caldilineaceae bacterium]